MTSDPQCVKLPTRIVLQLLFLLRPASPQYGIASIPEKVRKFLPNVSSGTTLINLSKYITNIIERVSSLGHFFTDVCFYFVKVFNDLFCHPRRNK